MCNVLALSRQFCEHTFSWPSWLFFAAISFLTASLSLSIAAWLGALFSFSQQFFYHQTKREERRMSESEEKKGRNRQASNGRSAYMGAMEQRGRATSMGNLNTTHAMCHLVIFFLTDCNLFFSLSLGKEKHSDGWIITSNINNLDIDVLMRVEKKLTLNVVTERGGEETFFSTCVAFTQLIHWVEQRKQPIDETRDKMWVEKKYSPFRWMYLQIHSMFQVYNCDGGNIWKREKKSQANKQKLPSVLRWKQMKKLFFFFSSLSLCVSRLSVEYTLWKREMRRMNGQE